VAKPIKLLHKDQARWVSQELYPSHELKTRFALLPGRDDSGDDASLHPHCHCERSDAIQNLSAERLWIASSLRSSQ